MLDPHLTKEGYRIVGLSMAGSVVNRFVHRLVATAFLNNDKGYPVVDHINRDRSDNRLENLRWCGFAVNAGNRDPATFPKGGKLTGNQVREIFMLYHVENVSPKEIAPNYGITPSTVGNLLSRKTWKHVTADLVDLMNSNSEHIIPELAEEEVWKEIPGYAGRYLVSNLGKVRSLSGKRNGGQPFLMTPAVTQKGYLLAVLQRPGYRKAPGIHRLVAEAFIPNPHSLPIVHHVDGNPANNRYDNLVWCDNRFNIIQSIPTRKWAKGVKHHNAKLTEEQVREIRNLYDDARYTLVRLAQEYGVSTDTIRKVVRRIYWTHI